MNTTNIGVQPPTQLMERTARPARFEFDASTLHNDRDDQIVIRLNGHFDGTIALPKTTKEREAWDSDSQTTTQKAVSKRSSRSFTARVSRQKSRRRELLGRQAKLDTSFTRHRGDVPHQVFPEHDTYGNGASRKSWFSAGRSSMKFKGLGITKGTPQPDSSNRRAPSIDREPKTADSLAPAPGTATWNEISPWDRPIPIGITVPTDSVSDFSPYQGVRQRSGSDTTLVTPSIVITPAMPMQSVWSPDTPYTESDYTPSVYSRNTFNPHTTDHNVPPVPALPLGLKGSSGAPATANDVPDSPTHNRNDTVDSNETAFEEDSDDAQRKNRVMSSDTFFEEDETPLRERTVETAMVFDHSLVPTPRRSQGWWNVITTPFVTTPLTGTWPKGGQYSPRTPDVPTLPLEYSRNREVPLSPDDNLTAVEKSYADHTLPSKGRYPIVVSAPVSESTASRHASPMTVASEIPADASAVREAQNGNQQTAATPDRSVTSPQSAISATPVVATAAMATVLMPRQVEDSFRPININIELQDRRPDANLQLLSANSQPVTQQSHTSWPALRLQGVGTNASRSNSPSPNLPTFAPPPTFAYKGSHFSYDNGSRASSSVSLPDLKRQKKHRKVFDMTTLLPFLKRKGQEKEDEKKKKKRGCFFWCCGCCLILTVLLAVLIPIIVVFSRKKDDTIRTTPITTQPGGESTSPASEWLTLTNLPPIPTGVLTIAQPEAVEEESGCVAPTTLWSCALPKELHESVHLNKPDQPNLKIEITFDNSSEATKTTKRVANAVSVGAFIRERFLNARSAPSPSPAPPSSNDMAFLGKTTDGNSAPFEGEDTPLFVSFQDPATTTSHLPKRGNDDPTNITASIPAPMLNPDGTAAPANLLPRPSAQPLRLYNRGNENEHYGFYTYYDRSIFLKQINGTNRGGNPADTDGGSTEEAATLRCTFSETRFLVQIWTRSQSSKPLLQSSTQGGSSTLQRPGTFPYPVTVTIDRHGGNAAKKNLYCYNMESDGTIKNEASKRSFQFEDRAFGGNLVNGTQGRPNVSGPIDGGSGGCSCKYQNWLD
ncbi:glycoprotease family protein [Stagonosporopsis vannaccii]|nr:glycoprotease family protein [Stagonosporopsis vannaccii]